MVQGFLEFFLLMNIKLETVRISDALPLEIACPISRSLYNHKGHNASIYEILVELNRYSQAE